MRAPWNIRDEVKAWRMESRLQYFHNTSTADRWSSIRRPCLLLRLELPSRDPEGERPSAAVIQAVDDGAGIVDSTISRPCHFGVCRFGVP